MNKANKAEGYLNDNLWRNQLLITKTKTRIYEITIRLIITYTAEIRAAKHKDY